MELCISKKADGSIEKYSFSSLSEDDQSFVTEKYQRIKKINTAGIFSKQQLSKSTTDPIFIDAAFAPFKPNVATRWDENYFYVESLGIAEHAMMVGITSWQQQVPIPQCYIGNNAWSIPLNPEPADTPLSLQEYLMRGAVAIAANGIPIFNPLNNRGDDAYLVGELDEFGGHSGRADDYHYHIAPLHLEDKTTEILPIAYALDGYAIYGSKEPDGSDMQPLDQYNGHVGSDNVYHYHATESYPYVMGAMVGKVTTDNSSAESQILPQASTTPVRPFLQPLVGAVITGFEKTGEKSYSLVYTLNNQNYTVNYDWTSTGEYNFEFVDPNGSSTKESHNGFIPCEVTTDLNTLTGSVTQGLATTLVDNLLDCANGRVAGIGTITATDNSVWTVPAEVNFQNDDFPFAPDLYNSCNGATYNSASEALSQLDGSEIVEVNANGEIITGYIFADNYFEMYINGVPVGKDKVPFTQFNSSIVRFKVSRPFTIAVKLVDWEENLGLGSENNGGFTYHPGDGGFVATFFDESNNNIAVTNSEWKAQTYYIAPLKDINCISEDGNERLSSDCDTQGSNDGSNFYAVHYEVPSNWFEEKYDDSAWPSAYTFTNQTVGVDNKPAYTNFTNLFDNTDNDAQFIWSSNLILDNLVLARFTVDDVTTGLSSEEDNERIPTSYNLEQNYPNPFNPSTTIAFSLPREGFVSLNIYNSLGQIVTPLVNQSLAGGRYSYNWEARDLTSGIYLYVLFVDGAVIGTKKMILLK